MMRILKTVLLLAALTVPTLAASSASVTHAWLRALPGGLPAGGYFTLHNPTGKTLTLRAASSPACGMLMLHKSQTMSGMASMDNVETVDVRAGGTLDFSPGGYHLMCMQPKASLKPGSMASVTLIFADGDKITTDFAVRGANGK